MKRTPLKRKKRLKRVSARQRARMAKYFPIQQEFLRKNIWCMICVAMAGLAKTSTEVHHIRGRNGSLLFDTRFFVATCRACRMIPHLNPKWAREAGFLAEARDWNVVPR